MAVAWLGVSVDIVRVDEAALCGWFWLFITGESRNGGRSSQGQRGRGRFA